MAIRMRRGPYADMDPTKMIPGEWAVAIDSDTSKQVIWMCFAPGIVKRMGTYEDFKKQIADATEDIKTEYLEEFQAIIDQVEKLAEETGTNTDTVVQIRDNTVNTYLPQMLKYLENAAAASNTATLQAQAASTSASAAKVSEENTKSYMERAFSATPEGYDALVDNVNMLDIHTTTDATLYGSKSGGLRVNHMVGNTEQRQLSGKNVFKYDKPANFTKNGVTVTYNDDGSITFNGTCENWFFVNLNYKENARNLPNGKYIFSGGGSANTIKGMLYIDGVHVGSSYANSEFELTDENTSDYIRFEVLKGAVLTNETLRLIVRLASIEDPTYEPYCGGVPAPNPEYPQSINNVGDCVEMIQGRWNGETGAYTTSTTSICTKNSIPCKSGDKVKVVLEKPLTLQCVYSTDSGHLSYKGVETVSEYEFTVPSNATKFKFNVINADGLTPQTVGKIQLTINGKYVVQIVEHGKNFVKVDKINSGTSKGVTITYNKDGSITLNGTATEWQFVNLNYKGPTGRNLPKGKYKLVNTNVKSVYFCVYVDGVKANTSSFYNAVFEITDDTVSDYIRYERANGAVFDNVTIYPMIVSEDETDLTFEPYTESTATILLDEPLREGDRLVKVDGVWQVERHSAEVVFDGSDDEVFVVATSNAGDVDTIYVVHGNSANKSYVGSKVYCDKLLNKETWSTDHEAIAIGGSAIANNIRFRVKRSRLESPDVAGVRTYLSNNPYTVQYKLATPTYEILDTASQIALNSLKTFDTVTYLSVDSVTQPEELEVEFGKSKVGARVIKNENDNDIDRIERKEMKTQLNELATALVALGSEV